MVAPFYKSVTSNPKKPINAHSGLWFERFFEGYQNKEHWDIPKPDKNNQTDSKRDWIAQVTGEVGDARQLKLYHDRQDALVVGALKGLRRCYKTDWHFVSGMGNPHPVENGFSWHPTLAVPYLAGSAVKGLVRAWVEMNDAKCSEEEKNRRLKNWFGTEDKSQVAQQSGAVMFFDALPRTPPLLINDVMTPHFGDWYEQGHTGSTAAKNVPADWHEPVPVPFLAVQNAEFMFALAMRGRENRAELDEVFIALDQALCWLGAGAKTAAGYGYMTAVP